MDKERRKLDLLGKALDLTGTEGLELVRRACADDEDMLRELEALLAEAEALSDDYLDSPAVLVLDDGPGDTEAAQPGENMIADAFADATEPGGAGGPGVRQHPERIGPFQIVEVLGEGGMGVVYLAEQSEPVTRQVALKLVRASLQSPFAAVRFEAEHQAMARLSHTNVAQLFEAGMTDEGFPYFAMEHVPGETLTSHCDGRRLSVEERLRLFIQVCEGVQHAHQKGILHRDLKPSNLLVADIEGRSVPKVIDFGIAKALDEPLTEHGDLTGLRAIGTPAYMSPEALEGSGDVDTRADVYSLGMVLYELLAGVRPHEPAAGDLQVELRVTFKRGQTPRPSTRVEALDDCTVGAVAGQRQLSPAELARKVRGDLDRIVMKAIANEPDQRYASAAELAADIERHLGHEPVTATPPSAHYLSRLFVRRNRVAVAATALVAIFLVAGVVGASMGLVRARRAEMTAARESEAARQMLLFMTDLVEIFGQDGTRLDEVTSRKLLDKGTEEVRRGLADQPVLRARVMRSIGDAYGRLGLYGEAAELLEESVTLLLAESSGDGTQKLADTLHERAAVYRTLARDKQIEALQDRQAGMSQE